MRISGSVLPDLCGRTPGESFIHSSTCRTCGTCRVTVKKVGGVAHSTKVTADWSASALEDTSTAEVAVQAPIVEHVGTTAKVLQVARPYRRWAARHSPKEASPGVTEERSDLDFRTRRLQSEPHHPATADKRELSRSLRENFPALSTLI